MPGLHHYLVGDGAGFERALCHCCGIRPLAGTVLLAKTADSEPQTPREQRRGVGPHAGLGIPQNHDDDISPGA